MEETNLCSDKIRTFEDAMEEASSSVSGVTVSAPCNPEDEIVAIVTKKDTVNNVNMVAYNFLPEMLTQVINTTP
jgi:hypothetical protein